MFNGLQEGIIVLEENSIDFMNDISNKILSHLTGLRNFQKSRTRDGSDLKINPMDMKLFYLFQNAQNNAQQSSSDSNRAKG